METKIILNFLKNLQENNSLAWMQAHKSEYLEAKAVFAELLDVMIGEISRWDSSLAHLRGRDIIFRLNRDTRFSKDKSPYKAAFRAHISAGGRAPIPAGCYLHIEPGESFLGGGVHAVMFQEAVRMVRDHIEKEGRRFQKIIEEPGFSEAFRITGTRLQRVPAGYDKEHPLAEYLKYKSWDLEVPVEDCLIEDGESFVVYACSLYERMKPFHDFLNEGLKEFQMPKR